MKTCLYSHKFKLLYHSSRAISIAISCAFAKIAEFSQSARSVSGKTTVFLSVVFITEKLDCDALSIWNRKMQFAPEESKVKLYVEESGSKVWNGELKITK